jgi:class 3 adenylate cyclase
MYFSENNGNESKDFAAVKVAKEVENLFKSHNRKYGQKIVFGIGVHVDTFIVEMRAGSKHFTPMGTGISYVRKIAEHAHDSALLSDAARERTRGQIKVDKDIGGMFWGIRSVSQARSAENEEFLKRFLSKNKFES